MTTWNCPVRGCDFGDAKDRSREGVLSHVYAKADNDHDEAAATAVKQADNPPVTLPDTDDDPNQGSEATDKGDEPASDPPADDNQDGSTTTGDGAETADEPDADAEAADQGETSPTDHSDEGGSEAMATPDEYETQYDDQDDQTTNHPDQGEPPGSAGTSTNQSGGFDLPVPGFSTTSLLVILGALVVLYLVYQVLADGSEQSVDDLETPDEDGRAAGSDDPSGLVDVEAGTEVNQP